MHIPDGYLGPATYGGAWAVMLPIWRYASKKVRQTVQTSEIPFLAMGTVFSLVAMMFMLPLPGGTTGHISGTTLVAILLGPWAAVIAVSISVVIQAVLLGDGGITAIGANCFNIAFVGAVVGWGIYALILRVGAGPARRRPGGSDTAPAASLSLRLTAAAVASYAAINLGALMAALELGSQPLLYAGSAGSSVLPLPVEGGHPGGDGSAPDHDRRARGGCDRPGADVCSQDGGNNEGTDEGGRGAMRLPDGHAVSVARVCTRLLDRKGRRELRRGVRPREPAHGV